MLAYLDVMIDIPLDTCKVSMEHPFHGLRTVAMFVLDIMDTHSEVVAIHERQRIVREGEIDLVFGSCEVELRVIHPHVLRPWQQGRCRGGLRDGAYEGHRRIFLSHVGG